MLTAKLSRSKGDMPIIDETLKRVINQLTAPESVSLLSVLFVFLLKGALYEIGKRAAASVWIWVKNSHISLSTKEFWIRMKRLSCFRSLKRHNNK